MYAFNKAGVIAYAIIATVLLIIVTVTVIKNYVNLQYDVNNKIIDLDDENSLKSNYSNEDLKKLEYEFYFAVVNDVLNILVHICLLIGAYKCSYKLLVPYLILRLVAWAVVIVAMLYLLFIMPQVAVFILLIILVISAIDIAIWIGVYGFYKKLKNKKHNVKDNEIENKILNLPPPYEKV